jgi:HPt (histidine-containing phosphotransfer) domain-containing protein
MMDRDPARQRAEGVQDMDTFKEACAVFGEENALARLGMFRDELEAHLSWVATGPADHQSLRDMAHRTAGRAGVLGFAALADASAQLDEAARDDTGLAATLDHWMEQAKRAARG